MYKFMNYVWYLCDDDDFVFCITYLFCNDQISWIIIIVIFFALGT